MKFKLQIKNNNKQSVVARVLYAINYHEVNFGFPDGIVAEVIDSNITYKQILASILDQPSLIKFIGSTNNRQLFFNWQDQFGGIGWIEPCLTIHGKPRPEKRKKISDSEDEWSWVTDYTTAWNPKKWNIADTHETPLWTPMNYVEAHLKKNQEFILQFQFIKIESPIKQLINQYIHAIRH